MMALDFSIVNEEIKQHLNKPIFSVIASKN